MDQGRKLGQGGADRLRHRPIAPAALILASLLLSGCLPSGTDDAVPSGASSVTRVILYPDTVTVEMRDRSLCTGPRTQAGPVWEGRLAGCRHLWPYRVEQPAQRVVRLPLTRGAGGIGQVTLSPPNAPVELWSGPQPRVGG